MGESISEVGYKAGVCGHDGTDWIKALIDAAGHLQIDLVDSGGADLGDLETLLTDIKTAVEKIDDLQGALNSVHTDELDIVFDGQNADVEVTQTTPADLVVGVHSYDGAAWRRNPPIFGISDSVSESVSDTNLGAGDQTKTTTAIPAGEVHVVSAINFRIDSASCTRGQLSIVVGGVALVLLTQDNPVAYTWYLKTGEFVLAEDDYIGLSMTDLTAGDDCYLRYAGYRMDVDL